MSRVYFTRPRAGADHTNRRSRSVDRKQLQRGSRTCRPFAPNQGAFKEDRSSSAWLDPTYGKHEARELKRFHPLGSSAPRQMNRRMFSFLHTRFKSSTIDFSASEYAAGFVTTSQIPFC